MGASELPGPAAGGDLRRCYWIGGSPCAGKSSLAAMLASRHGLLHVECDVGAEQRLARMSGHRLAAYEELRALGTGGRAGDPGGEPGDPGGSRRDRRTALRPLNEARIGGAIADARTLPAFERGG